MYVYLADQATVSASLTAQNSTAAAGAINGSAVDISGFEGPLLVCISASAASTDDTITFTVQESPDGTTSWTAVTASELVNPNTGDAATFTVVDDSAAVNETLALKRERLQRYLRVVATTAGSTIDVSFAAFIVAQKAYA